MDALPNIIPKSIVEILNRLENDEDNPYSWKLMRNQDSLSLTVSCKLPPKTPRKAKDKRYKTRYEKLYFPSVIVDFIFFTLRKSKIFGDRNLCNSFVTRLKVLASTQNITSLTLVIEFKYDRVVYH